MSKNTDTTTQNTISFLRKTNAEGTRMPMFSTAFWFQVTAAINKNRVFRSLRNGMVLLIPFILIRALALALLTLPLSSWQIFLLNSGHGFYNLLGAVYQASQSYFSLLTAGALAFSFAREWRLKVFRSVLLNMSAVACFWIFSGGRISYFGPSAICTAIFSAFFASFFFLKLNGYERFFKIASPPPVLRIDMHLFDVLYTIPIVLAILLLAIFAQAGILFVGGGLILQKQLNDAALELLALCPISQLFAAEVHTLLAQLPWFFGINGNALFLGSQAAFFTGINAVPAAEGTVPILMNESFFNCFARLGGSGAILALSVSFLTFSTQKFSKLIAKLSLLPACFNVSEVAVFGFPLIGNPIFLPAILLIPMANLAIAYGMTRLGLIPPTIHEVSWAVPPLLSGYAATGSLNGAAAQLFLLLIDLFLFEPFVKLYDRYRSTQTERLTRHLEKLHQWYEAKAERFNPANFNDQQSFIFTRLMNDLEEELSKPHKDTLFMVYQPQIASNGKIIGAESLLRWKHPDAGFIYPPLVITLAKRGGFLPKLEEFIFRDTCECIARLEKMLGKDANFKVSANITGESLLYDGLDRSIRRIVQETNIDPRKLWIEITEQDTITLNEQTQSNLENLKAQGHQLIVDDFGMGQTSINYLQTGLFGMVKLDGSITRKVLTDQKSQQIVSSLTSLSRDMNMMTVAEYVDNVPQRDQLKTLGCDIFQGYLYSPPVSENRLMHLIVDKGRENISYQKSEKESRGAEKETTAANDTEGEGAKF